LIRSRRRWLFSSAAVVAATAAGLTGVALSSGREPAAPAAPMPPPLEGQVVWPSRLVAAPDFTLRDERGRLVSLRAQRGVVVVLAFMDSRCHRICPLEGHVIARAVADLPAGNRTTLLVVSVNPWGDTPTSARRAVARWRLNGSRHWLFGTREQLATVWESYRIYVKRTRGDIVHSDSVYLIDRSGHERAGFQYPFPAGPVRRDVLLLNREGRKSAARTATRSNHLTHARDMEKER
jgi:cytochrome oxidase Cu insertion factor (SCO1/SenC/PrrC family)